MSKKRRKRRKGGKATNSMRALSRRVTRGIGFARGQGNTALAEKMAVYTARQRGSRVSDMDVQRARNANATLDRYALDVKQAAHYHMELDLFETTGVYNSLARALRLPSMRNEARSVKDVKRKVVDRKTGKVTYETVSQRERAEKADRMRGYMLAATFYNAFVNIAQVREGTTGTVDGDARNPLLSPIADARDAGGFVRGIDAWVAFWQQPKNMDYLARVNELAARVARGEFIDTPNELAQARKELYELMKRDIGRYEDSNQYSEIMSRYF